MQIRSQLTSSFRPFFPSMINQYGPPFFTAAATTAASTLCAKLLRTLLYFFLRHANFNERGDNNNKIWYNNRWMGLFWCRVMESGCDECSLSGVLQEEGDMKDVYASFSPAQPSDAVVPHVIIITRAILLCTQHNFAHGGEKKKKKLWDFSLPWPPFYLHPPPSVNSFFNAFVFPNWAPYCALVSFNPLLQLAPAATKHKNHR